MTLTAQRIAIATHLGWTQIEDKSYGLMMPEGFSVVGYPPNNPIIGKKEQLPDWTNDLNACHEAEKTFSNEQWKHFRRHLFGDVSATATKRADAFLRTLGLWRD